MATITVASAKTNQAARIEFTGITFGDLKRNAEFLAIYGSGDGVDAVVKPGNVTLRDDQSTLPSGNFSIFLVPTKNKAGVIYFSKKK